MPSPQGAASSGGEPPKPMPMAIMRNAHEVIRGATKEIQGYLDADDMDNAVKVWKDLHRFGELHMTMEEGMTDQNGNDIDNNVGQGLFAMMDTHANNAATEHQLRDQHTLLTKFEEEVQDCLVTNPSLENAKQVFPKFMAENEAHLIKEEEILMPAVQKMAKSGVPVKKHIKTYLMPVLMKSDNMEFFLKFGNKVLEKYEQADGKSKTRVFDQAIWSVASPEQWKEWDGYIREALSDAKYNQVIAAIQAFDVESGSS